MDRIFQKSKKIIKLRVILVVAILLLLFFQLASGGNSSSRRGRSIQTLFKNKSSQSSMGNFQSSFEMKENVDFLLTPAFLVQEAISENVITTYPSE